MKYQNHVIIYKHELEEYETIMFKVEKKIWVIKDMSLFLLKSQL